MIPWQVWCPVKRTGETVLVHSMAEAQLGASAILPCDSGAESFTSLRSQPCLEAPRTGSLQSFLLQWGLCYHLLNFKTNIRQKQSHLMFATLIARPRKSRGSTHGKEQDLPFIHALKEQGSRQPWLSAHITT